MIYLCIQEYIFMPVCSKYNSIFIKYTIHSTLCIAKLINSIQNYITTGLEIGFFFLEAGRAGNEIFPPTRKQIHLPMILLLRL